MQHVYVNIGGKTPQERAEIEARRGITRDSAGRIIRTPEWISARIEALTEKRTTYLQRIANIEAELKSLGGLEYKSPAENPTLSLSLWDRFLNFLKGLL